MDGMDYTMRCFNYIGFLAYLFELPFKLHCAGAVQQGSATNEDVKRSSGSEKPLSAVILTISPVC